MKTRITGMLLTTTLGVLALSACDSTMSPAADFDPEPMALAMDSMVSATDAMANAFGSMDAAGTVLDAAAAGLLPSSGTGILPAPMVASSVVERLAAEGFFPSTVLGVTYVFDATSGAYVASDQAGAPADGLRIIYYAMDPALHQPASPLTPLGYVDLRDLGTTSSLRLGITVVSTSGSAEVTLADYYIDITPSITDTAIGATLSAVGYISDGTRQVDFDLGQTMVLGQTSLTLTQDFTLGLAGTGLQVSYQGTLTGDYQSEAPAALDLTVSLTNGSESVVFDLTAQQDSLDGIISHNRTVVVNIGGTFDQPEFTDPNGEALDPSQIQTLQQLFEGVASIFETAQEVFSAAE